MKYSFFLYGAYDENQKCHARYKEFIVKKEKAYVKGSLHVLNCGLGLLSTEGSSVIPGHLVDIECPESYLAVLDMLSGYDASAPKKSFVHRVTVQASVVEAQAVETQTYCLNPDKKIAGLRKLDCGELETYFSASKENIIDKLTERQKTYIQKLAQAKGREIVPVDMALYRELMSLELIVDKGRRLALTRLGSEVSLFL